MIVKLDVTVVTAAPSAGLLSGLPVGANHVVFIDLNQLNHAGPLSISGKLTSTSDEYFTPGTTVGNVTVNSITLTNDDLFGY